MFTLKPYSRFIFFTLSLLLLLSFFANTIIASDVDTENDEDDEKELEELLALDEQEDLKQENSQGDVDAKLSEAKVLSKAQRIVIELNPENVKKTIEGNEFVLVLGYAPWCPRSAELMPRFAEAATLLNELESPLLLAKLDAERYPKAASKLQIKGFPTLLLFVNGTSQPYTGGFSAVDIVIWARKKTGAPVIRVNSVNEAEDILKKYPTFVLGLFNKFEGHDYEEFVKAAVSDNEIQFVESSNSEVAKVLYPDIKATKHFLGIVKSEPEKYTKYEESFEKDKILQFLAYNKFPLVTKLTEINSASVYSSPIKTQVFVFAKDDDLKSFLEPLQDIARKFKTKLMFIAIDITDDNLAKPFLTLLGLEESKNTVMAAFDNKISSKFLLESDLTPSNIEEFCSGLLHGTLSPYYKSQPIPDNTNASVHVIVGKTFDDLVLNSPENVLLEIHTPWCIKCETTSKQIEKLASHFKGLDNLVIAKIDASMNEHPKLHLDDYPTILFYPAGDKANPIKVSTKSSSKDLAAFINKQLKGKDQVRKDFENHKDEL
ncbi:putative Protein disulfide isomerase [Melia azedarach]|uniref:Uncharacterized protein n=1 Tax=Melia azedarach TaxID=155640 RepID=A0ACC1Y313_MELAZ|nr:putative Protein disulfide isomerase [Melia azedarach]